MPKNQSGSEWRTVLQRIKNNDPDLFYICTSHVTDKPIGEEETKALGAALKYNTTVKTLVIKSKISDKGAIALSGALKINKTLTTLDFPATAIGAKGIQAFRDALKKNQTLEHLILRGNNYIDLVWERYVQQTTEQRKRLNQFTQVLITLGRESAKTASQSLWFRLPTVLEFYFTNLLSNFFLATHRINANNSAFNL